MAFGEAYTMGGRRRSAKFDSGGYFDTLFKTMGSKAATDGRKDAAAAIDGRAKGFNPPEIEF